MLTSWLTAYLIGSFPSAYVFTKWFGKRDIRHVGSENVGATNVAWNIGWLPGVLTLAGDLAKGYLAALVGGLASRSSWTALAPAFAIAGHNWPVWLGFHGGGGLATFVGACLRLSGLPMVAAALGLWGLLYYLMKDHDRSAVAACVVLPVAVAIARQSAEMVAFVASSSFTVILRRIQSISNEVRRLRRNKQSDGGPE